MHDEQFARSLAEDVAQFLAAIRQTPDPFETLSELLLRAHKTPRNLEVTTKDLLEFAERDGLVECILNKRNSPRLQPLLTLYGGPAERTFGDELWGKGWGVRGRYEWKE